MKKTILFFAAVCPLFFYSCDFFKGNPTDVVENPDQIILDYTNKSNDSIWTSNRDLKKWHEQYLGDQTNATYKKGQKPEPYQYVDFKLDELKHLIWLMEKSANNVYLKNEKAKPTLGLRVYYTQYTEGENEGLNSVVLSPIFNDGKSNKLYNPRSKRNQDGFIPLDIRNDQFGGLIKGTNPRNLMMFYFQARDEEGTNLNHGMSCPEKCQ